MIKHLLPLCFTFPAALFAADTFGCCSPDQPEIGDIGPSSEVVCRELQQRFPDAPSAVEDRIIVSPNAVTIRVSVDGVERSLDYALEGFTWRLTTMEPAVATLAPTR